MSIAVTSGTNLTNGIKITSAFDPTQIFVNNEQGYWLDPNDFDTMFQDPVGTTPVTDVGQGVSLMLDKSKGLVPGPELVKNGDFSQGITGWSTSQSTITNSNNRLLVTATVANDTRVLTQVPISPGKMYRITGEIVSTSAGSVTVATNQNASVNFSTTTIQATVNPGNTFVSFVVATATNLNLIFRSNSLVIGENFVIDNISVREVPGNHFTQANVANAPILGREPIVGRRNLITDTTYNQFTVGSAWPMSGGAVLQGLTLSVEQVTPTPQGNQVRFRLEGIPTSASQVELGIAPALVPSVAPATVSLFIESPNSIGVTGIRLFRTNQPAAAGPFVSPTTAEQRLSYTHPSTAGQGTVRLQIAHNNISVDATFVIYYPQYEAGTTPTVYQRVGSQFDVTESGMQTVHYLSFDGTDDWLQSVATIDPGNIDKVQVFAGVRKLSDAARGLVVEASATVTSNSGAFAMNAPFAVDANYNFTSRGNITAPVATSPNNFVAPITNVLTGIADISADNLILRVNGTQVASNTADQGTGNYLTYIHYIGRRGGTTFALNGRIYQLITRYGPNLTTQQIQTVENYVTNNTLFTIGSLFTNNTGALFESFDQTTLFQDDIGTQPVTATGQAVGLWYYRRPKERLRMV